MGGCVGNEAFVQTVVGGVFAAGDSCFVVGITCIRNGKGIQEGC